jgi:hypothetical protein
VAHLWLVELVTNQFNMIRNDIGLAGKFKFDVYTKDGNLKYTTNYLDNFITPTGLNYPKSYAFADCFRYLSIGTGTGLNTNVGAGTTGLDFPLTGSGYAYVGGGGYSNCSINPGNQYYSKGCGYRFDTTGLTLYRAWRIPDSVNNFFTSAITLNEYMLTPGRPATTGYNFFSSGKATACTCQDFVYQDPNSVGPIIYGKEAYDFGKYYTGICSATQAFTRILKSIDVAKDEFLVINYSLTLNFQTGIKYFKVGVGGTSPLGDSQNWDKALGISGYTSLVHPGIKLINNGNVHSVSYIDEISNYIYRVGESFVPPLGIPLEPSCPKSNHFGYISNDNLQFLVNDISGGPVVTGEVQPFNTTGRAFSSGLMSFHRNWVTETSYTNTDLGGKVPNTYWCLKSRSERNKIRTTPYPSQSDFSQGTTYDLIAGGTFLPTGINPNIAGSSESDEAVAITGRSRSHTISYQFKSPELLTSEWTPVRAFVLGYKPISVNYGEDYYYTAVDTLFYPRSGSLATDINITGGTYKNPASMVNLPDTSGYSYFDNNNILQIAFKISWSAPCPTGVIGC